MGVNDKPRVVNVGMAGFGTVGQGVYEVLRREAGLLEKKCGVRIRLKKIAVNSTSRRRSVSVPKELLTADWRELVADPSIDIFVEVVGGVGVAAKMLYAALAGGKHVVTANKALIAERGGRLFSAAARRGLCVGIEGSVCGGIPIVKALRESLVSNQIQQILGIVNGTCNSILTDMSEKGFSFASALRHAQARGYAEKNPALDVNGTDSAHKLSILARLAFRAEVPFSSIPVEGIRSLSPEDIHYARELGYVIKLLAIGKRKKEGFELRVHPTMLPLDHPLAGVRGVYNAVFLHADQAGDLLFYGRGAGRMPTASAVVSDIVDIARNYGDASSGVKGLLGKAARALPIGESRSHYYLRFQVADRPGVLGELARTLGRHRISIMSVHQKEAHQTRSVPVVILTYEARERDLEAALGEIRARKNLSRRCVVVRVEK